MKASSPITPLEVTAIQLALVTQIKEVSEGMAIAMADNMLTPDGIKESQSLLDNSKSALQKIQDASRTIDFENADFDQSKFFKY